MPLPTLDEIARAARTPIPEFIGNCHHVSAAIVRSGLVRGRVARGWCRGIRSQHSWVVEGDNPYSETARIIDATRKPHELVVSSLSSGDYAPHGWLDGVSIFAVGKPPEAEDWEEPLELMPSKPLSRHARHFLSMCGPMARPGWAFLANHAPVKGWPAGEIYEAMEATPALRSIVPIDRLGMTTDLLPDLFPRHPAEGD